VQKLIAHRLYTEDVNRTGILLILNKYFHGYTVFTSTGVWEASQENSICIELIGVSFADVTRAANDIKALNSQDAVLYTAHEVKTKLF
jgi:hypothetical protein